MQLKPTYSLELDKKFFIIYGEDYVERSPMFDTREEADAFRETITAQNYLCEEFYVRIARTINWHSPR